VQLLYPGRYSDLLIPNRHYIPLARDYSNLDNAISLILDERRRRQMSEAAHAEVLMDKRNWIEDFVALLDRELETGFDAKGVLFKSRRWPRAATNVLMLALHDPKSDPRLDWISRGAPQGMLVHQLGCRITGESYSILNAQGHSTIAIARQKWQSDAYLDLLHLVSHSRRGTAALHELKLLDQIAFSKAGTSAVLRAPRGHPEVNSFEWMLNWVLDASFSLIEHAKGFKGVEALIAADLLSLPSALVLGGAFGVPVIYDAHEYWPEARLSQLEFEGEFWRNFERRLVQHVDYRQTVSPGLAEHMSLAPIIHEAV
jgi:hypothetical protein